MLRLKRLYFLILLLFLFLLCLPSLDFAYRSHFKLNVFASVGYTGGNKLDVGEGSLLNYRAQLQLFYKFHRNFALGLDLVYLHAFTTEYPSGRNNDAFSNYKDAAYLAPLITLNFDFFNELFLFQTGVGPYIGISDNLGRVDWGFMVSIGLDIPIVTNLSFTILSRFDFIFSERFLSPVNVLLGFGYRFRFDD